MTLCQPSACLEVDKNKVSVGARQLAGCVAAYNGACALCDVTQG